MINVAIKKLMLPLLATTTLFQPALGKSASQKQEGKSRQPTPALKNVQIQKPIKYQCDEQEGNLDGFSVLKGHVKIEQDDMTIWSDRAELYWKTNPNTPEKIILLGNVIFQNADSKGKCQKGIFYYNEKKLIMSGNPSLEKNKSNLEAETIIYFTETKRFRLKKPRSVIVPEDTPPPQTTKSAETNTQNKTLRKAKKLPKR